MRISKWLLLVAAALLVAGAGLHTAAFPKIGPVVRASSLPTFHAQSYQALWLGDSATLFVLATILVVISMQTQIAARGLLLLLAVIPLATGVLLYAFIGNFFAAHLLIGISALIALAALARGNEKPAGPIEGVSR